MKMTKKKEKEKKTKKQTRLTVKLREMNENLWGKRRETLKIVKEGQVILAKKNIK